MEVTILRGVHDVQRPDTSTESKPVETENMASQPSLPGTQVLARSAAILRPDSVENKVEDVAETPETSADVDDTLA